MTLNMYQEAYLADDDCTMNLDASSINAAAEGKTVEIPFETNLIYNLNEMYLTITYPSGQEPEEDWIVLKNVEEDKVTIEIAPNTTGAERKANVKLTHTDAGYLDSIEGNPLYSNTITVVQTL